MLSNLNHFSLVVYSDYSYFLTVISAVLIIYYHILQKMTFGLPKMGQCSHSNLCTYMCLYISLLLFEFFDTYLINNYYEQLVTKDPFPNQKDDFKNASLSSS